MYTVQCTFTMVRVYNIHVYTMHSEQYWCRKAKLLQCDVMQNATMYIIVHFSQFDCQSRVLIAVRAEQFYRSYKPAVRPDFFQPVLLYFKSICQNCYIICSTYINSNCNTYLYKFLNNQFLFQVYLSALFPSLCYRIE